ncbi:MULTISPECIES: beta-galactosidase [unclassified Paenibacillus]|uniref:beta-galactosidase n=1 Tax=unclassified Paenibacillus TaxID=185978 RepID=UPI00070CDD70|nr:MULTISPECIES: beta-galactosidase [unclassified Paenibacillus]KQX44607.1 hypothetical protein ASD40_21640 [Paenibacillus sp. Root444D2]KRE32916.1 hypothetical protein ASG85_15515 [Paenibacillus sp. Soil724D2]
MDKTIPGEKFDLRVGYYPKHWPEKMWADEMREIGFTIVRMGEFTWNSRMLFSISLVTDKV